MLSNKRKAKSQNRRVWLPQKLVFYFDKIKDELGFETDSAFLLNCFYMAYGDYLKEMKKNELSVCQKSDVKPIDDNYYINDSEGII